MLVIGHFAICCFGISSVRKSLRQADPIRMPTRHWHLLATTPPGSRLTASPGGTRTTTCGAVGSAAGERDDGHHDAHDEQHRQGGADGDEQRLPATDRRWGRGEPGLQRTTPTADQVAVVWRGAGDVGDGMDGGGGGADTQDPAVLVRQRDSVPEGEFGGWVTPRIHRHARSTNRTPPDSTSHYGYWPIDRITRRIPHRTPISGTKKPGAADATPGFSREGT